MYIKKQSLIILFTIFFLFGSVSSMAKAQKIYPENIRTVFDLQDWLVRDFTYQPEIKYEWKKPLKTVIDRGGDCEDFANLVCHVLKDLGKECKVIGIFAPTYGHAIAVFKDVDGNWSHFSNQIYTPSRSKDIRELLNDYYGDWNKAYFFIGSTSMFYKWYTNRG